MIESTRTTGGGTRRAAWISEAAEDRAILFLARTIIEQPAEIHRIYLSEPDIVRGFHARLNASRTDAEIKLRILEGATEVIDAIETESALASV